MVINSIIQYAIDIGVVIVKHSQEELEENSEQACDRIHKQGNLDAYI